MARGSGGKFVLLNPSSLAKSKEHSCYGSVFQQGKKMGQAKVNASILNNEQTHQGVCWSCLLTNIIVIETLCLLQDAK